MKKIRNRLKLAALLLPLFAAFGMSTNVHGDQYVVDSKGKHAFIQFKVSHLGYSYVIGTFPDFEGTMEYDSANPGGAGIQIDIDTTTVDSSHADRNKHIRSGDFLDVANYPDARFVSTSYTELGDGTGTLVGDLTLRGVTKEVTIETNKVGEGKDPWGGYRIGFEGNTTITMADFDINYNLGPASRTADLYLIIEAIRQ